MKHIINEQLIIWVIITSVCSYSQTANPTRPSAADNAYLTEYGYTEIEMGYMLDQNNYYSLPALLNLLSTLKLKQD